MFTIPFYNPVFNTSMTSPSALYSAFVSCNYQVVTDSRKVIPGCMYWGLKGETFDGSDFAEKALKAGAACAVVEAGSAGDTGNEKCLPVVDTLLHLQHLAHMHRKQFSIPVIAICGSNGKTTTKELLVSVLKTTFYVHATQGNLNNHIGVPLTLLQLRPEHTVSVIEIGANHLQEVYDLCKITAPTHGIITSIGKDHLEGYGSVENVAASNAELFQYLSEHKGYAWVNAGDPYIRKMNLSGMDGYQFYAGDSLNQVEILELNLGEMSLRIRYHEGKSIFEVKMQISGKHNALNALAVTMIAKTLGVQPDSIVQGLSAYRPDNNRSQVIRKGEKQILLDAYNANPTSVEAAIHVLRSSGSMHNAYILGDMFELGEYALQEHRNILGLALTDATAKIILAGVFFSQIANEFPSERILCFESTEALLKHAAQVKAFLKDVSSMLIKGSRSMKMESVMTLFDE